MAVIGWQTEGPKINAVDGLILADTGPSDDGTTPVKVSVLISTSVAARVDLELRDDTNTVSLRVMPIFIIAGQTFQTPIAANITLTTSQRLRLVVNGAVIGTIGGSLFVE